MTGSAAGNGHSSGNATAAGSPQAKNGSASHGGRSDDPVSGAKASHDADPSGQTAQFARFQIDAPSCDNCGNITVRNGNCYLCHNCGNSMGCS